MGIAEGLALHSYVNELPRKEEEAKLKAQLFKSQADHYNAQTGLLQLQTQQEQAFQAGLPQALAGSQPTQAAIPPDLASQPAGPNAGAPTIGQLHTTDAFADPDSQQMQRVSGLALRSGNMKHFSALQQGLLEMQKVKLQQRTQQLQDQLAMLQQTDAGLPDVPVNAKKKADLKQAKVSTLFQMGKTQDAMELLSGKVVPLQAGGTLMRAPTGEGEAVAIGQSPTSLAQKAFDEKVGANAADLGEGRPGAAPVARPPVRTTPPRALAGPARPAPPGEIDTPLNAPLQLLQGLEDAGVPPEVIQQVAPHLLQNTAPAVPEGQSPVEKRAALTERAKNREAGLESGNPANPVVTQETALKRKATVIPREAAEQLGVPVTTTYGMLEAGKVKPQSGSQVPKQLPGPKEREDLASYDTTLESANTLLTMIEKDPKASELLGGFLMNPQAATKRFLARHGASADPEARRFLATYGVTAALLRSKLIGLAQTNREMQGLTDFVPGPEAGPDAIKAGIKAIIETTTRQRSNLVKTQSSLGVKTPQGGESAPPTAPAKETPQQLYERKKKELGLP